MPVGTDSPTNDKRSGRCAASDRRTYCCSTVAASMASLSLQSQTSMSLLVLAETRSNRPVSNKMSSPRFTRPFTSTSRTCPYPFAAAPVSSDSKYDKTCSENHKHAYSLGLKTPMQSTIGDNRGKSSNFLRDQRQCSGSQWHYCKVPLLHSIMLSPWVRVPMHYYWVHDMHPRLSSESEFETVQR